MSVKTHEPFCLDSAQDKFFWFDHFLGDQLKDEWRVATSGSIVVVDQQVGGVLRSTTGAVTNNNSYMDWFNIRSLLVSKKVTIEWRAKLTQTALLDCQLGLRFTNAEKFYFLYSPATSAEWLIYTIDMGATQHLSGVNADTDYHTFRIEAHTHGSNHLHFYIDGVETDNSPLTVAAKITTDYLQPWFFIVTKEDAAKSVDLDYVVVRQER